MQHENLAELAKNIAYLDSGSLAALRRGPLDGAGVAAFWKLVGDDVSNNEEEWAGLIQAIAILTPKGKPKPEVRHSAYDHSRQMGAALQKAGVSELRLARLLAARKGQMRELLVRLCRRLSRTEYSSFNLKVLRQLMLYEDNRARRELARDYYRAAAKDRAAAKANREDG